MRVLLLAVGLIGVVVFVLGPDMGLGPAALVAGVALVAGAGSAWLVGERRRDVSARESRMPPRR